MIDMKEYIPRPLYAKRIEPFIDKALIKVITGQPEEISHVWRNALFVQSAFGGGNHL